MAIAQYTVDFSMRDSWIRENDDDMRWLSKRTNGLSSKAALEKDINRLRKEMEQAAKEQPCLTSEPVVTISRLLDAKINEYMRRFGKN